MSRPLPRLEYQEKATSISEGVWSANYRWLTLGLILIILGPAFETLAVATILPKIVASAWVVPGLIGPALAGIIADFFGWRWVFLGLVLVLPLGSGLVLPALKKLTLSKEVRVARSWDLPRLLATAGLVAGAGLTLTGLQV